MGSEIHEFRKLVGTEPGQPNGWAVRDVTAGVDVAKGTAANPGAADTAATAALTSARAAEKTRLQAIVNPFALDSAAAITAAYAALPT